MLNSNIKIPSADTIRADIIKCFNQECVKIQDILQVIIFFFIFIYINFNINIYFYFRMFLVIYHLQLMRGHQLIIFLS
jgi:hypothetical protein